MYNKKIVAGILTGVAAGVTIALILNTKKGRETGKNLLKKGNRLFQQKIYGVGEASTSSAKNCWERTTLTP